jgi:hypothetical protein
MGSTLLRLCSSSSRRSPPKRNVLSSTDFVWWGCQPTAHRVKRRQRRSVDETAHDALCYLEIQRLGVSDETDAQVRGRGCDTSLQQGRHAPQADGRNVTQTQARVWSASSPLWAPAAPASSGDDTMTNDESHEGTAQLRTICSRCRSPPHPAR